MAEKTEQDVERLLQALKAERNARKDAEREAAQLRAAMLARVEALEARPAPNLNAALTGIAEIRRDVMAEVSQLRAEIDDLAASLAEVMRRP